MRSSFLCLFCVACLLFFTQITIAADDIQPPSLEKAATWAELAKKIKDAESYEYDLRAKIPATGMTNLNTNLNNAIKNGVDSSVGGLTVAQGIKSAYRQ